MAVTIRVELDDGKFQAALDEWMVLAKVEGRIAALEGAHAIQRRARLKLLEFSHPPGTKTPSPPGGPPGSRTGRLVGAVEVSETPDGAEVGVTRSAASFNGPYGGFLETGGVHSGNMHWFEDGQWHRARRIVKGPRPYFRPAVEEALASGEILRNFYYHWDKAQRAVTHV